MKQHSLSNLWRWGTWLLFAGLLIALGYSVIRSGYGHGFDGDEYFHAQYIYLLSTHLVPFRDFYVSVYLPIFHWFLLPLFTWLGFSFETMSTVRYVMILLFFVRVGALFLIVRALFGKLTSWVSLSAILLDPFTVFSAMQIRPDNLMMTLYTLGFLALIFGLQKTSRTWVFTSGALVGLSLLTLAKILPGVVVLVGVYAAYCLWKRKLRNLLFFVIGIGLPLGFFLLYALAGGFLGQMYQQVILDAKTAFSQFGNPMYFGFFHIPNNVYIYGVSGMPLSWIFEWLLLLGSFVGAYHVVTEIVRRRSFQDTHMMKVVLVLLLLCYQILLLVAQSVFIQYYLVISWLYVVFTSVAIASIYELLPPRSWVRKGGAALGFIAFALLVRSSIHANLERSTWGSQDYITEVTRIWKQIPADAAVFPTYLFRPLGHPLFFGYFRGLNEISPQILARYPSIPDNLEERKIPFLVLNFEVSALPTYIQDYISAHYKADPSIHGLFRRVF